MGKQWKQCQTLLFWAPKSLQMVIAAMKLKDAYSLESYEQLRIFKSRDITLSIKVCLGKAMVFPVVLYVAVFTRLFLYLMLEHICLQGRQSDRSLGAAWDAIN